MTTVWSDRQSCSHNVSKRVKRIRRLSEESSDICPTLLRRCRCGDLWSQRSGATSLNFASKPPALVRSCSTNPAHDKIHTALHCLTGKRNSCAGAKYCQLVYGPKIRRYKCFLEFARKIIWIAGGDRWPRENGSICQFGDLSFWRVFPVFHRHVYPI